MNISDNTVIVFNDIYNLDLLLNKNKENEKIETNLETRITISESNTVINLLIINIQILSLPFLSLILSIETNIKSIYNTSNNERILFLHLAFGFWCKYTLISKKNYKQL